MTFSTDHIPHRPGVYLFKDKKGDILYIGKAKNLKKRVDQYFSPGSVRKQEMVNKAHYVDFIEVTTESEALYLEDNLIKKHQPEFNRLLKADNSYVFIKITKEDFPQVLITRKRRNDGATYIGPKHNSGMLRKLLHYLRQIYKFRTESASVFNKAELSSDYYFGLDAGRSVIAKLQQKNAELYKEKAKKAGLTIDKTYDQYVEEYKKIIQQLIKFFNGNTKVITKDIKDKITLCISQENFEYAAILRDIYLHIDQITEKQNVVLDTTITGRIIQIRTINNHHILIMINFFEGKIVDIVRQKYEIEDRSYNQLITASENDFGPMKIYENDNNKNTLIENKEGIESQHTSFLLISDTMKKINKAQRHEICELMEKFIDSYLASDSFRENSLINDLLSQLQQKYSLTKFPYTMECLDISHLSGGWISGGLSHFQGGIPYTKGYRNYKIQSVKQEEGYNNDYKALKEVIIRRFLTGGGFTPPDLFIIDGGKGQLNVIKELLASYPELQKIMETTQFVSLGKGDARKTKGKTLGATETIYSFDNNMNITQTNLSYDQADKLIIKLRDEAHRFANRYRKKQMSMEWKN